MLDGNYHSSACSFARNHFVSVVPIAGKEPAYLPLDVLPAVWSAPQMEQSQLAKYLPLEDGSIVFGRASPYTPSSVSSLRLGLFS